MKVLVSWSSGKDSAWCLQVLRQRADLEVVGLVTTVNETYGRVAMHAVREVLLELTGGRTGGADSLRHRVARPYGRRLDRLWGRRRSRSDGQPEER